MTNKGITISATVQAEATRRLDTLELGDAFRLPSVTWEEAIRGDAPGGCFYRVLDLKKDGLIGVVSLDGKLKRKLPEETEVIEHALQISIVQNRPE